MDQKNSELSMSFHWSIHVTIMTVVTLLIIIALLYIIVLGNRQSGHIINYIVTISLTLSILLVFSFMPYRLCVDKESVQIKRIAKTLKIPLTEIDSVSPIQSHELNNLIRTFGSGGLFGYLGNFKNEKIGKFTMYATERKNLVMIKTHSKTFIISCSEREKFLQQINKFIHTYDKEK